MKLRCQRCGVETSEELDFCQNCCASLIPRSTYDLNLGDFAYKPDLDAIQTLKVLGPLPYFVKNLAFADLERTVLSRISEMADKVTYPSDLDALVRKCATLLSVEFMPEVFIVKSGDLNAYTFGDEVRAFVVVDAGLLGLLTSSELMALFGHELGHVKSGHMMYHTLAEVLGGGISLSVSLLGLDVLSIPVRFALLSWHRESEVTGDRTALLVVNDINVVNSLMTKLSLARAPVPSLEIDDTKRNVGVMESVSELFQTHPLFTHRLRLLKDFSESEEFLRARQKIELRQSLTRGLIPICRFCGAKKFVEELFCPSCGRCQT